ncbi:MBL fold metallo-hydrolase [Sphingomonas montanisoli]|nr:MBL fold metallo-hydrolase [Sphingomonas montanisoli]
MLRWLLLVLGLSIAVSPLHAQEQVQPDERVVRNVVVRSGPSTDTPAIEALVPGETLPVSGDVPLWYRVQLDDGRTGYVSKAWTVPVVGPAGIYRVHSIDVGTGLALFVEGPGFTLLYDAGTQDDTRRGAHNRVVNYLRKIRPDLTTIDHLILSHAHKDHLYLMPDIFAAYAIRNVWDSGRLYDSCGYRDFLDRVSKETGVAYHNGIGSDREHEFSFANCQSEPKKVSVRLGSALELKSVPLGTNASMRFLYLDTALHEDPNENSLVVRLDLGGKRVLLMGDAEAGQRNDPASAPDAGSIEANLLSCCASDLRADVLVAGHHGSKTSSRTAFLDAVKASTYVISSGPYLYSGTGLPDHEVVAEFERRGTLFRTDRDDGACKVNPAKIGADNDGKVGGCDNILIELSSAMPVRARYLQIAD